MKKQQAPKEQNKREKNSTDQLDKSSAALTVHPRKKQVPPAFIYAKIVF